MTELTHPTRTLAIDIGGTGLKALVMGANGRALSEKVVRPTPSDANPESVLQVLTEMMAGMGSFDRVSVGFPGVIAGSTVRTAKNLGSAWEGFNLEEALERITSRPVRVANDADVQGLAVVEGRGVELVITLGTGMGSALFVEGMLLPNLELGQHLFKGNETYDDRIGKQALGRVGKEEWNRRLFEVVARLEATFSYRMLFIGGGNASKIVTDLPANVRKVSNDAGLVGGIRLWEGSSFRGA